LKFYRDVFWKGTADEGAYEFAELLGLKDELHQMVDAAWKDIDEKVKASTKTAPTVETNEKSKT
jgi:hypothetical protein